MNFSRCTTYKIGITVKSKEGDMTSVMQKLQLPNFTQCNLNREKTVITSLYKFYFHKAYSNSKKPFIGLTLV